MTIENYQKEIDLKNNQKTQELLSEMPGFVKNFFNARQTNTSTRTRLVYAYDLRKFFNWLHDSNPEINAINIKDISYSHMDSITAADIEDFITFLMYSPENTNDKAGVARKLSCLSSFFSYLEKHELITKNPCNNVDKPKIPAIEIIKLTPEESVILLDTVLYGSPNFTKKQRDSWEKSYIRDYTIISLLLSTGIRVSELVGLNCSDIHLKEFRIIVRRKGGNIENVYLSDEMCDCLKDYLFSRDLMKDAESDALFLSIQKKRLGVQSVEDLVKKYAQLAGIEKNISPHKLRKTFGTELYKSTGDIYLVASSLGHSSVATTTRHYAVQDEINKLGARNQVKLNKTEE